MFKSKYSTFLTIALIVVIVAIIIIATILVINTYKNYQDEKEKDRIIAEINQKEDIEDVEENVISDNEIGNVTVEPIINTVIENTTTSNNNNNNTSSRPKVKYYKNFPTIGTIKIEKTNIEYPILLKDTPDALETSVGITYPQNPELNKPGVVVIAGHNYRNGKFFANNKKLTTGDKIKITDLSGKTLTYTIYEIFETTHNDTAYYTRERGDNIEIALSTCTDSGNNRLVILARVQ